jgi:FADH2-dependent halogenase
MLHPRHRKVAVFAHFHGVHRDAGDAGGDTVIVRLENRWFWLIPVSDCKTSVGVVMDPGELSGGPEGISAAFTRCIQSSPVLRRFMVNAERVSPMHTTGDFSYFNRRLVGHRLIRVGDAAGFLDPIFSSGVFLAMWSGELAADTVAGALTERVPRRAPFERYEARMRRATRRYWRMVEAYYTWPFMELFLQPRRRFDLPSAVNALLAGELEPGWNIRWRLALFFLLVRIQSYWPLVPRLSAGPTP